MDRNYRIIAKNFPSDLVARVSEVHAIALLSMDMNISERPDTMYGLSGHHKVDGEFPAKFEGGEK